MVGEGTRFMAPSWACWMPGILWLFDSDFDSVCADTEGYLSVLRGSD